MQSLLAAAETHREWAIEVIEDLVRLESPSTDKVALDRCGAEIARLLVDLGARVNALPQAASGDHLRAEFGRGSAQVLVLGHFDTVWPVGQLERMPLRREAGRLFGPGTYDMKGGIAVAMLAARILRQTSPPLRHRLVMLWTSDEEMGSATSRALLEAEARSSRAVLVLEPALSGGGVKTARKGVGDFRIEARGVSAHAGVEPGRGASAVHELAWQALRLLELEDRERGLTVNIGRLVGGSRSNVVADSAAMDVDVRVPTIADAALIAAAVTGLVPRDPRVEVTVRGGVNRPPMERTPEVEALYRRALGLAQSMGRDLPEGATGGASDGNFTAALGVPTLDGLGPDGGGAHALDEHVQLDSIAFRAALLAALVSDLS
jgi:glutamate carboxypeptidase